MKVVGVLTLVMALAQLAEVFKVQNGKTILKTPGKHIAGKGDQARDSIKSMNTTIVGLSNKEGKKTTKQDRLERFFASFGENRKLLEPLERVYPSPDKSSWMSDEGLWWSGQKHPRAKDVLFGKNHRPDIFADIITTTCASATKEVCELFTHVFPETWDRAITMLDDSTVFVVTGDIPAMWLRDSSAQVTHYVAFVDRSWELQVLIEGVLRRQMTFIKMLPYASAFRMKHSNIDALDTKWMRTKHIQQYDFEPDSYCYFLRLAYNYWKKSDRTEIFDTNFLQTAVLIVAMFEIEQNHDALSTYTYPSLKNVETCYTGMVWGGARPSDDPMQYHFNIPVNMFIHSAMQHLEEILAAFYQTEKELLARTSKLRNEVMSGINNYGIVEHAVHGKVYAYEVDGCDSKARPPLLQDDANVPSLLSAPYLEFPVENDVYANTRSFILSKDNPNFHLGEFLGKKGTKVRASGIGSQHTGRKNIWPLAIAMQGLTGDVGMLQELTKTTTKTRTGLHESFNPSNPSSFSRAWFGWPDALFAELALRDPTDGAALHDSTAVSDFAGRCKPDRGCK